MAEPIVISSLKAKRAELDGDLMQAEKLAVRLRSDLDAIDRALKVFDPSIQLGTIRPVVRRSGPRLFAHGHFSRAVLDVLRRAEKPLSYREIAERLKAEHRLNSPGKGLTRDLVKKVRTTLRPGRPGVKREIRDGELVVSREPL
jgi:hypothetical protein